MVVVIPNDWNGAFGASDEVAKLRQRADVRVFQAPPKSRAELVEQLRDADVVLGLRERTRFPADLFDELPKLKVIAQIGGAETPHIDQDAASKHGVIISYSGGGSAQNAFDPVVELIVGMLVSLFARFPEHDRAIHQGMWPLVPRRSLEGKTLGVVSLGRIGGKLAKIAPAFGMRVIGAGITLTPERAAQAGAEFRDLASLFAEADAISINLKLTDQTRGLITKDLIGRMKPDAYLINTSRGPIVDEKALVEALQQRRIGGAGLDVFDEEPLAPDHPLRRCDNALLIGHAGWPTDTSYERLIPQTLAVVHAFLDGNPINVANPAARAASLSS